MTILTPVSIQKPDAPKQLRPVRRVAGFELAVIRIARAILKKQIAYLQNEFLPFILNSIAPQFQVDSDPSVEAAQRRLGQRLREIASAAIPDLEAIFQKTADHHTKDFVQSVKSALRIDLKAVILSEQLAGQIALYGNGAASLIYGASDQLAADISRVTIKALGEGLSHSELSKRLAADFTEELHGKHVGRTAESRKANLRRKRIAVQRMKDPTKGTGMPYRYQSRYELIARDQLSKLRSRLDQLRQEQIGIDRYRWQTAQDERVRETHRRNNGTVYKWSAPPITTGHPGEDVNCRCIALAIVE